MNFTQARADWAKAAPLFAQRGLVLPGVVAFTPDDFKRDYRIAMDTMSGLRMGFDAQPGLSTDPNSAIPALLTTLIDPEVYRVLFAPNKAAVIIDEVKKGTWLDQTAMFPVVEHTGEASTYGDFNNNGRAGVNMNWPQRQSYLFQVIMEVGDLELERAGLGRIGYAAEVQGAVALTMNKALNTSYFFGVNGLQNYGLLNDPHLSAPLTPAPKAWGGTTWFNNGSPAATANEVFADIQAVYEQVITQSAGTIGLEDEICLAMSPNSAVALTFTNSFNVSVADLLKKNFPRIRIETAVQYQALTATNPQGNAGGNFMQMIVKTVEGQRTGYAAFNEKMRAHALVRDLSSFKQKMTGGTWGTILRTTVGIASMVGI